LRSLSLGEDVNNTAARPYRVTFIDDQEFIVYAYEAQDAMVQACVDYANLLNQEVPALKKIEAYYQKKVGLFDRLLTSNEKKRG